MPHFAEEIERVVDKLNHNPNAEGIDDQFVNASDLVYNGMKDIRRAVIMNKVSMSE